MKLRSSRFIPLDAIYPFSGLNTLDPSPQMDRRASPVLLNMRSSKGVIVKRGGTTALGRPESGYTFEGTPMALAQFQDADGDNHLVCFTTTKQYWYNAGTDEWEDITGTVAWTGDRTNFVNWTVAVGDEGKYLIATNGKDAPIFWDGDTEGTFEEFVPTFPEGTGFTTCEDLLCFYQHLILVGPTLNGSKNGSLILWSETSKIVDFEEESSGAGSMLVSDALGEIRRIVPLGDRAIIYTDDSVGTLTYVGGLQIFLYETLLQDVRLLSPHGVVNVGGFHLVMRKETISLFDGTRVLRDVGDAIHRSYVEKLDLTERAKAFGFLDTPHNSVYFAIPTGSNSQIFYLMEYDTFKQGEVRWSEQRFGDEVGCMGFLRVGSALHWDTEPYASMGFNQKIRRWNDSSGMADFPKVVLGLVKLDGESEVGDASQIDGVVITEEGEGVEGEFQSVDFAFPEAYLSSQARWAELELELCGRAVEVSVSLDRGESWEVLETLSLGSSWKRYSVKLDLVSPTLRVRLRTVEDPAHHFEVRWIRPWVLGREARFSDG